ncbi:hypothetical protein LSH36_538g01023 [Paralvinella palmiformis]|uniref:SH3 domain-containing GRB2-like protein B1 n=1 Tax=Paralvinella palmiformis TaxID=53620 RepID=A0AAD9J847_9ANNE|nr:hypothetical protein LSH36_538g01023 [Paralvinella palmiformis]
MSDKCSAPPWSSGSVLNYRSLPPCSNLGMGISEGCFVFDFTSLPLEVARPIKPTMCTKVAVKRQSSSSDKCSFIIGNYNHLSSVGPVKTSSNSVIVNIENCSTLVKVGQTEQKLGNAEKDFIHSASNNFLQPLKAFLDGDMKTLQKERRVLEAKRLDLDAAKGRLRRAKSVNGREQAEADVRKAQAEFDRQAEITKLLLEGISSTHAHHLRCLHDFVEAQATYYSQCQQYMSDLTRQLGSYSLGGSTAQPLGGGPTSPDIHPPSFIDATQNSSNDIETKHAKVLYDYDAADMSELSLKADEVIQVTPVPGKADWFIGQRGSQRGRIPAPYVQLL